jgi:hypothetical protein
VNKALTKYLKVICWRKAVPEWCVKVLYALLERASHEEMTIVLPSNARAEMKKKYHLTTGMIHQGTNILVKSGLLIRKGVNYYALDPLSFPKGKDWMTAKMIAATLVSRDDSSDYDIRVEVIR